MRFADMMNRIKQDIAWPNERARDDAVLELVPKFDGTYDFPDVTDFAKIPEKVHGKWALEYINAEESLPRECYPTWVSFGEYKLKNAHSSRRGGKWPQDVPQVLPDFYTFRLHTLISSFARDVLDAYCPGAIEYIEVEVKAPPAMIVAPRYYFLNVLTQAQMIDWSKVDSAAFDRGNGIVISWAPRFLNAIPFKPLTETSPLLWYERRLDSKHRTAPGNIYVRGVLWNALVDNFDQQFQHDTQLSLEK